MEPGTVTVEDLIERSPGAYIRLQVLCYDEWSSARTYFSSPHYNRNDIADGDFTGDHHHPDPLLA